VIIHIGIPQAIITIALLLSEALVILNHGKTITNRYDARWGLLITVAYFGLLYWGGFYK
jgi:hypothetical protein